MRLRLANGLALPLEAATQTLLIVGKRGSGKSTTGTRFVEQLIDARVPVAILDPVDVWWGLKAGADGKREGGKEVYVFGGRHADLPLEPTAGELMADLLVDHRVNAVMVLREFSNREKAQFGAAFADRLYRRNTEVLQLIVEEAHELMPQQPYHGEEEMLGRMLRLQKLGRTSGIGMTSVTQRPASLNKNATTQAEILIAHRLIGPQDVRAVEEWIKHHRVETQKQAVLSTLHELKTGEAWVWAPDFPEDTPIGLRRIHVLNAETFDSRRTPKPGERRVEPKQLAPVDLERLGEKMLATRERAKQSDPKALQAEIRQLRAEARTRPQVQIAEPVRIEVPAIKQEDMRRVEAAAERFRKGADRLRELAGALYEKADAAKATAERMVDTLATFRANGERRVMTPIMPRRPAPPAVDPPGRGPVFRRSATDDAAAPTVGKGEMRVLTAIAQHPEGVTREQLTVLTGYKRSSRDTYLQRLRALGHVALQGDRILVMEDGVSALGRGFAPLPIGDALRDHWLTRLPEGERKVFEVVVGAYPRAIEKDTISETTGYRRSSRDTYLQRLRARRLITSGSAGVRASDELFDVALSRR